MRGKGLNRELANRAFSDRHNGFDHKILTSQLEEVGWGGKWDDCRADQVHDQLIDIVKSVTNSAGTSNVDTLKLRLTNDRLRAAFDRQACVVLHRELELPPDLAASPLFWRWLAVEKCADVIGSRVGNADGRAHPANYGIGTNRIDQNRMAILWLRAEMTYDQNSPDDPYHLAQYGHTDFWESGIIRIRYAYSRNLARAFVKFQYPDSSQFLKRHLISETQIQRENGILGVRELYKRLRRLHATTAFEYLSDGELENVLKKQSSDLNLEE